MQSTGLIKEGELFFRQWLRSPKSMGSVIPSTRALARGIAREAVWQPGQYVVELGAGTGAISEGLLERGIPRERLITIELDEQLHDYLSYRLPGCMVIRGDATKLDTILAERGITDIACVVSGLPMVGMPFAFQQAIIEQGLAASKGRGPVLQYSYSPIPPIPARKLGVKAELRRYVVWNFPPATVWRFSRH